MEDIYENKQQLYVADVLARAGGDIKNLRKLSTSTLDFLYKNKYVVRITAKKDRVSGGMTDGLQRGLGRITFLQIFEDDKKIFDFGGKFIKNGENVARELYQIFEGT